MGLGYHSAESGTCDAAGRRTTEVFVDRFDARPAKRRQAITHRILQGAALTIVEDLMSRGCRTYRIALRSRWCGPIFSDIMARLLPFPSKVAVGVVEDQADHQLRYGGPKKGIGANVRPTLPKSGGSPGSQARRLMRRYSHRSPGLNPLISANRASFAILRIPSGASEPPLRRRHHLSALLRGAWPSRRIRCPQNQWAKDHMIVMRRFELLQINGTYCRDTCL